ncbi:MAG: hypothetical protein RL660_2876 [Bacteroidota bacterium]|jgi:predicted negative regulator of RcsB-dependent stress response
MAKIDRYTAPKQTTQVVQRVEDPSGAAPIEDASERLAKIEDAYSNNKKYINIALGAIVGAALLFVGYKYFYKAPREVKAADALGKASNYMLIDSMSAMLNGDGRTQGVAKIAKEYSGTDAGNMASYMAGAAYLKQGKYKEAIASLKSFDGRGTILESLAAGLLGDAYWDNKQLAEAAEAYEKAGADEGNVQFSPIYLKRAGMVYEAMNKPEQAIAAYTRLKEKFPQSREALDADRSLARLGQTGI